MSNKSQDKLTVDIKALYAKQLKCMVHSDSEPFRVIQKGHRSDAFHYTPKKAMHHIYSTAQMGTIPSKETAE